nr:D-alanine--D-alanine ligase [Muribaculaceae bacterium]
MKTNVAVFFGGRSVEHEISVISANQAINAFDTDKYNIIP